MEQAIKDASEIHQNSDRLISGQQTPVFKLDNKSKKCLSCGKIGHAHKACNFYNVISPSCNKHGHIWSVGMSKPHPGSSPTPKAKTTYCLNKEALEEEGENIDIPRLHIFKCENSTNPSILIKVNVEGIPLTWS